MAFSTPRKPQRTQRDTLDGEEVLEITLFAAKREWIQDKITFLSTTLPRIVVDEPAPPLLSATTKEQLEKWWEEHETIEKEVNEYDYGDLTKMRNFAKQKSKQELSRRDTDLIEVCLTTIFALDKLLSLLGQRRKSLVLLGYRLQWEESLRLAWDSRRRLLEEEIPSFLSKSRFVIPQSLSSRSREVSLEEAQDSNLGAPLSKSLSSSSTSRRLSSLADPDHFSSNSSQSSTSSSMSRTLHLQMLQLSLSQLKSHLRQLSSTLLQSTSTKLDKLIDHSPEPLPETFLDEQDRIEDTIRGEFVTSGLTRVFEERVEAWRLGDEMFWGGVKAEKGAEQLGEEVEEETRKLRVVDQLSAEQQGRTDWVVKFEKRIKTIGEDLGQARRCFDSKLEGILASSSVSSNSTIGRLFPDLDEEGQQTLKTLEKNLRKAQVVVEETRKSVGKFRKGVEAIEGAGIVREKLRKAMRDLHSTRDRIERLGRPRRDIAIDWVQSLADFEREEADDYETQFDDALSAFTTVPQFENIRAMVKAGVRVVADLGTVGIDSNSRRELKELIEGVEEARKEVERSKLLEATRRERLAAVKQLLLRLEGGKVEVETLRERMRAEAARVRWVVGKEGVGSPVDIPVEQSTESIRDSCRSALESAKSVLAPFPPVLSHFTKLATGLDQDFDSLVVFQDAVRRTRAQFEAVVAFDSDVRPIRSGLQAISQEAEASRQEIGATSEELYNTWRHLVKQLEHLSSALSPLVSDVHLRIPFLSASTTSAAAPERSLDKLVPFDVDEQDDAVKTYLNGLIVRIKQEQEQAGKNIDSLEAASNVVCWNQQRGVLEAGLNRLQAQVQSYEDSTRHLEDPSEEVLRDLYSCSSVSSTTAESLARSLQDLSTMHQESLSSFAESALPPHLLCDPPRVHEALKERLSQLESRIDAATDRIAMFGAEREEKLSSWLSDMFRTSDMIKQETCTMAQVKEEAEEAGGTTEWVGERLDEVDLDSPDLRSFFERHANTLTATAESLASLRQQVQATGDVLAACSDDVSALETTVPVSYLSDRCIDLRRELNAAQDTNQVTTEVLRILDEGLASCREKLSQVESRHLERVQAMKARKVNEKEEEEMQRVKTPRTVKLVFAGPHRTTPRSEEDVLPSSSVSLRSSLSSNVDDVFGELAPCDPFAEMDHHYESPELSSLRAKAELLRVRDWLDDAAVLRLPTCGESTELRSSLRNLQDDYSALKASGGGSIMEAEFEPFHHLVSTKEQEVERISDLANFSSTVARADAALSNLLDSIDAATPGFSSSSLRKDQLSSDLSLPEAIIQASDAVTAVRLGAIPLVDDRRVEQAIGRIEESWEEMMAMAEEVRPRAGSAASSTISRSSRISSSSVSSRIPSRQSANESRAMSRSSSTSSTASLAFLRTRPSSRSTPTASQRTYSLQRSSSQAFSTFSTPRKTSGDDDHLATPRRHSRSGLPVPTPRRALSPLPPMTPTTSRPFSFASASKTKTPASSIPRRTPASTPRRGVDSRSSSTSEHAAPALSSSMARLSSTSSRASSRRVSLAGSVSSRRSSGASSTYRRLSLSPENLSRIGYRSSPPRNKRQYRANLSNKLDREVGTIVNALDIHVPIEMADGSWSDESGMYKIGDKVYFCRILRSKNVMVRVGGGWLNLLQFIITHFAPAETINISPTTPVKRTFGHEPQWISSPVVRDQLIPTQTSTSLRKYLTTSTSSHGSQSDQPLSASISMRRSISSSSNVATPLRRSFGGSGSHQALLSPLIGNGATRRQPPRPPIPVWRP